MYVHEIIALIGNTPLIKLRDEPIFAKAEFMNPGGSIKDRVALCMIEDAEVKGELKPGMRVVEPTSGNTGIGVTMVGTCKGYPVTIVMPDGMSEERKKLIQILGGELLLIPDEEGVAGAVTKAREILARGDAFMPDQFSNLNNPRAHYENTGPELWRQTEGRLDAFVSGVGSGGTLQGVGTYLKEKNPEIRLVAVEPANHSALLGHEPGLHQIQGIGDGFIPEVLDVSIIDEILEVSDDEAMETTRELARSNSFLVGTSSGANVWASRQLVKKYPGIRVATILPDRAERYFSTGLL